MPDEHATAGAAESKADQDRTKPGEEAPIAGARLHPTGAPPGVPRPAASVPPGPGLTPKLKVLGREGSLVDAENHGARIYRPLKPNGGGQRPRVDQAVPISADLARRCDRPFVKQQTAEHDVIEPLVGPDDADFGAEQTATLPQEREIRQRPA